jgi:hypothetical protein
VCTGTNSALPGETTTTGPARIVGTETLSIGGRPVRAVHQRQDLTISGAQDGTTAQDWWYAESNGLPLRLTRDSKINTKSPLGGTITYTEAGVWEMQGITPRT